MRFLRATRPKLTWRDVCQLSAYEAEAEMPNILADLADKSMMGQASSDTWLGGAAYMTNAHNHNWTGQDRRSIHSANLSSDKREPNMTDTPTYTPPQVWVWEKDDSPKWRYSNINRPIAGATHEKELTRGKHPLQLYSLATPNGVKVTIMLEELLTAGQSAAEYDAWLIQIDEGDQLVVDLSG